MKDALRLKSKSGIHRLISGWKSAASSAACRTAPGAGSYALAESLNMKVSEAVQKTAAGVKSASQKIGQTLGVLHAPGRGDDSPAMLADCRGTVLRPCAIILAWLKFGSAAGRRTYCWKWPEIPWSRPYFDATVDYPALRHGG